jgi:hypothetical protein
VCRLPFVVFTDTDSSPFGFSLPSGAAHSEQCSPDDFEPSAQFLPRCTRDHTSFLSPELCVSHRFLAISSAARSHARVTSLTRFLFLTDIPLPRLPHAPSSQAPPRFRPTCSIRMHPIPNHRTRIRPEQQQQHQVQRQQDHIRSKLAPRRRKHAHGPTASSPRTRIRTPHLLFGAQGMAVRGVRRADRECGCGSWSEASVSLFLCSTECFD